MTKSFVTDRLGSTAAIVTTTGTLLESHSFDPFGRPREGGYEDKWNRPIGKSVLDSEVTDRGYTGHEQLDESQYTHMNGRLYDFNLGRFLSVDPFIQSPGNSQSLNPYSYIMNNPLAGTDPSGYTAKCDGAAGIDCGKPKEEPKRKRRDRGKGKGFGWQTAWVNPASNNGAKGSFSAKANQDISSIGAPNARELASISAHVYGKEGADLPDNISQLTNEQLDELGLGDMVFEDDESGFKSALYYDSNSKGFIYAFAGTEDGTDWKQNFAQGLGQYSEQYDLAIQNAQTIRDATDGNLHLTGHSLGGGLASAASLLGNIRSTTFNAARVNPSTMLRYGSRMTHANKLITAYYVKGELLNSLQSAAGNRVPLASPNPIKWWHSPAYMIYRSYELHGMNEVMVSKGL